MHLYTISLRFSRKFVMLDKKLSKSLSITAYFTISLKPSFISLSERFDIKVFVDTDADIRLARRILRDVRDRGRSMESVITQYTTTVKPMHEEFVEPSKKYADVIIPEGGFNSVAVALLIQNIRSLMQEE